LKTIYLFSASPFTVDILFELHNNFYEIVTGRLDPRSREALCSQEDPTTMSDAERVKIRKSITSRVFGKATAQQIYRSIHQQCYKK
jgi:hypothetical protein